MATAQIECQPIHTFEPHIQQDLLQIASLQRDFNEATGIHIAGEDLLNRSYNPVMDRWHVEQVRDDPEKFEQLKQEIRRNIHTNLMERIFAVETEGKFLLKDDKLYSELFPNESFGQVLLRGANFRAHNGSREQKREGIEGELGGWLKITDALVHGAVGTKIVSLSPPGIVEKSAYDGKYVDVYEKTGKEEVTRKRIAVDFDTEKYEEAAFALDSTFFDAYDGRPLDAWYLSRPVVVTGVLPDILHAATAMNQDEFDGLYQQIKKSELTEYYLQVLTQDSVNWVELAKAFNTILTVADKIKDGNSIEEIMAETRPISLRRDHAEVGLNYNDVYANPAAMVGALGMQRVKQVGGGGCPPNRGFDFGGGLLGGTDVLAQYTVENVMKDLLQNSVGQFGLEDNKKETWDYHKGDCVVCKAKNAEVGPCEICKDCEKKF